MDLTINSTIELNDGNSIPQFGFGTYLIKGDAARQSVLWALEAGYRHIDTAQIYGNEQEVGQGIAESGIPREEIYITTKLFNSNQGYGSAKTTFYESMEKLGLEYVDLFLLHWPVEDKRLQSWRALEELQDEGVIKSIGVSNFTTQHLEELIQQSKYVPSINQIELHPFLIQQDLRDYCSERGIIVESYSPLTQGKRLNNPVLVEIGKKYNKTPAQICIRWVLQHGLVVIPKSEKKARIIENADVFDFVISDEDMDKINALNEDYHFSWNPTDPQQVSKFS